MEAEKSSSLLRSFVAHAVLAIAVLPVVLMSFQNCAPKAFDSGTVAGQGTDTPDTPNVPAGTCEPPNPCTPPVDPTSDFSLVDHAIQTEVNVPKSWTAPYNGDRTKFHISLGIDAAVNTLSVANQGVITITDTKNFNLTFTPAPGFLGRVTFTLFGNADTGEKTAKTAVVYIDVGNSLSKFQPAMAVRGSGCVMCHGDVRSNIITDFGYGSSFYFGQNIQPYSGQVLPAWWYGGVYGDHQAFELDKNNESYAKTGQYITGAGGSPGNWAELIHQADKKVYVPTGAPIPVADAKTRSGATTLAGYLTNRLAASAYADTRTAGKVVEKSTVYIGAPTADRLKTAFAWDSTQGNMVYKKDAISGAYDLSGMVLNGNYYKNSGSLVCEGDLFINGTVYLNDVSVRTRTGCRIYATGSVYIYGTVTYETLTNSDNRNLQIVSSRAILMGLGSLYNGSTHCEQTATAYNWYYKRKIEPQYSNETAYMSANDIATYNTAIANSAVMRLSYFWTNPYVYTRAGGDPTANGKALYTEMMNTIGTQKDAACYSSGRGVSYTRLLLNAPRIESRYNGNFSGSIVAEASVMALGQFKFEFDPVFSNVQILPKLQDADFLKIE